MKLNWRYSKVGNYSEAHDVIITHLQELYIRHRALDAEATELHENFASDQQVNRVKTQKLWIKDEIHRCETELKALGKL